jgi:hypothetical protein
VILVALPFACALPSFVYAARQMAWPRGEIFEKGTIPMLLSLGCVAFLGGKLFGATVLGDLGIVWFVGGVLAYFIGGPLVMAVFRRWSGIVSLLMAPALTITSLFIKV